MSPEYLHNEIKLLDLSIFPKVSSNSNKIVKRRKQMRDFLYLSKVLFDNNVDEDFYQKGFFMALL